jgi:hypothetical protein
MKIAIVSDTHGNVANLKKAVDWIENQNIQMIFHCGDIGNRESLKESLENFSGKFFAVLGNMDADFNLKEYKKILEIKIENKKFAITHKPDDAKKLAESGKYDLVFYGHTHKPWQEKVGNCRMINPGELAGQIFKPAFAVYDTENDFLELKILELLTI